MSAFHRMVTYLHLYDHNIKGRNIGFAKIEKRGTQCLIEIHMKNTGHSNPSAPVSFYAQKQQSLPGIFLGNINLNHGNGDFKAILEEGQLSESGYALEDVKGIFIPVSEDIMFVSQWDNDPFVRKAFLPLNTSPSIGTTPMPENTPSSSIEPFKQEQSLPNTKDPSKTPSLQGTGSSDSEKFPTSAHQQENTSQQKQLPQQEQQIQQEQQAQMEQQGQQAQMEQQGQLEQSAEQGQLQNQDGIPAKANASSNTQDRESEKYPQTSPQTEPSLNKTDSPNSLEAAEAIPKRNQPVYRNPFALPRFMPFWQQDFSQGQRPRHNNPQNTPAKNSISQNISSKNRQKQMPPKSSAIIPDKTGAPAADTFTNTDTSPTTDIPRQKQPDSLPEDWPLKWQFLLENYPVMTPFAGDENTLCIRMELKDLRLLPQKYWYLGNNSFLLHGFFNYRYLILGMTEQPEHKKWFIGVPGIFQNPERVMATLFGFPKFRNEKSAPINTGEFGYWYRFLDE